MPGAWLRLLRERHPFVAELFSCGGGEDNAFAVAVQAALGRRIILRVTEGVSRMEVAAGDEVVYFAAGGMGMVPGTPAVISGAGRTVDFLVVFDPASVAEADLVGRVGEL